MKVGELCNREVVVVEPGASIKESAALMRRYHVGDLVVVEDRGAQKVPRGILTDRDIVVGLLAENIDPDKISAGDLMSFDLLCAREEDDLLDSLQEMRRRGVRRLPVVNAAGGLEGILTLDDLLEVFAEQLGGLARLVGNEQTHERRLRV